MTRTDPAQAHKLWQQGCALMTRGDTAAALRSFEHASRLQPCEPVYWLNLARAQMQQFELDAAAQSAKRALALEPDSSIAVLLATHCLLELGHTDEALALLQAYPEHAERDAEFHFSHGRTLEASRRYVEAIGAYLQALALNIRDANVHARMGFCFQALKLRAEAAQSFRTALTLGMGRHDITMLTSLTHLEREVCRWDDGISNASELEKALRALPADAALTLPPFALLALFDDPQLQLHAAQIFSRDKTRGLKPLPALLPAEPLQGRRLRVGYVSSDYFNHATMVLMAGMLEAHDRNRFEITLYSYGDNDGSAMRDRALQASEHFVDVSALSSEAVARRIREDRLDILVELKGHTFGARIELMGWRMAPVQVAFLGFPGSSGGPEIDYIIGDPVVTPLEHATFFSEAIAQLPGCYQPNDSRRPLPAPASRASAGLPEEALVLCAFNQPFKISPEQLDVWCEILRALPGSVLWLLEWNDQVRHFLSPELARRGMAEHVVWAPPLAYADHIARFQQADLYLDSWPCNGHTTVSDALWAGVPVVTRRGRTFASRVAASLNHAMGLNELIVDDWDAYVECAVALGREAPRRKALREQLASRRGDAALFNSERFARDIEALYLRMAEHSAAGLAPDHLPAAAVPSVQTRDT